MPPRAIPYAFYSDILEQQSIGQYSLEEHGKMENSHKTWKILPSRVKRILQDSQLLPASSSSVKVTFPINYLPREQNPGLNAILFWNGVGHVGESM
jgi:hypothetical protein